MEFGFDQEYKMIQKTYREFAEKEIKPLAAEIDEQERFPKESIKKMADMGMLGIPFPEEYGGEEGDYLMYVLAVEELSKVCGEGASLTSLAQGSSEARGTLAAPVLRGAGTAILTAAGHRAVGAPASGGTRAVTVDACGPDRLSQW